MSGQLRFLTAVTFKHKRDDVITNVSVGVTLAAVWTQNEGFIGTFVTLSDTLWDDQRWVHRFIEKLMCEAGARVTEDVSPDAVTLSLWACVLDS